jgi:mRNA export factor
MPSPLKWQTRKVACFPDGSGFAISSIEGRVAIHHIDESKTSSNFAFKCHRDNNNIHSVNSLSFHPVYGTFCTAGSDGYIHFWDKDSRQRLESTSSLGNSIVTTTFNQNGTLFAYALCYDWSKVSQLSFHCRDTNTLIHPRRTVS